MEATAALAMAALAMAAAVTPVMAGKATGGIRRRHPVGTSTTEARQHVSVDSTINRTRGVG